MSKGFIVAAQNTDTVDYIKQAYVLALSIKNSQKDVSCISIMTNDSIPDTYRHAFDQIIPIPWVDDSKDKSWKVENRWKLYHVTPYDETIVLDTDMLLLEDISLWWRHCSNYELLFCNRVKNYKNELVLEDTFYRNAFIKNNLSNPYFALHYFKKSDFAHEFYKVLEFVVFNWEWCWTKFAPDHYQNWLSMDLASAIAIEISGCHGQVLDSAGPLEFVHMKPALQNWIEKTTPWSEIVPFYVNSDGELIIGNMKQTKLVHYVEKSFLSESLVKTYEGLLV
jgi:hypothetical protein